MRTQVVAAVVIGVPILLIGARLITQELALSGPPGGSATIEGDRVKVSSRITARLVSLEIKEGDQVQPGQLLATLDCSDQDAVVAANRAALDAASASAKAAMAQAEAAGVGTSTAYAQSKALEAQAAAAQAQRDAASRQAQRVQALEDGTSPASIDQASTSAEQWTHQSAAAFASAQVARLQVGAARGNAAAAAANAEAAAQNVQVAEARLNQSMLLQAECQIKATRGGVVETLPYEIGELVPMGSPIVSMVDLHEVKATFYLPNAELGGAKVGQAAKVVADAWPDRVFDGVVAIVGPEAAFTPRNVQTRTDRDRLVYPVEVHVQNPDDLPLRPGMPVQVTLREQ